MGHVVRQAGVGHGGNDTYRVIVQGRSGHAAMPHLAVDPIYVGTSIVQQLQGLTARHKSPLRAG
nr:peptidase dimerization domain-containing protein [Halomonas elongata]